MSDAELAHSRLHPGLPACDVQKTILLALRRLAIGGLNDALATSIFMGKFGMGHRRPLMFLRVMTDEISRVSRRKIMVAPCGCCRMTDDETTLLAALQLARTRPIDAHAVFNKLTDTRECRSVVAVAHALGDALADLGYPMASDA